MIFFKTVFSCFDDDVKDFKMSSYIVTEEKKIVRSWNQEIHSQIIITYLINSEFNHFEIISQMWMKTRAAKLQINLRYSKEKK